MLMYIKVIVEEDVICIVMELFIFVIVIIIFIKGEFFFLYIYQFKKKKFKMLIKFIVMNLKNLVKINYY